MFTSYIFNTTQIRSRVFIDNLYSIFSRLLVYKIDVIDLLSCVDLHFRFVFVL